MKGGLASLALVLAVGLAATPGASAQARDSAVILHVKPSQAALGPAAPGDVATLLRRRARRDQAPLLAVLRAAERRGEASGIEPLWIADAIALRATPQLVARLRGRADVLAIKPDRMLRIAARGSLPGGGRARARA